MLSPFRNGYRATIILVCMLLLLCPIGALAEDGVVAKVNGVVIGSSELEQAVDSLIPKISFHGSVTDETRAALRQKALEDLISRELEYQDAVARGVKLDEEMVKKQMEGIRKEFATRKEYQKALDRAGTTEDGLRKEVEKNVLVGELTQQVVIKPSRMTDAMLKDYYDKNRQKFVLPESIHIRVISTKEESKAKEALQKIKDGEDFGNVAARMSEDNYRIMGGDAGYIHRGRMVQEVEDLAWKLDKGAVGGPVKSGDYWFVIRVEDKAPQKTISFDEAKDRLRKQLEEKRAGELMDEWVSRLKAKAKVEIFP